MFFLFCRFFSYFSLNGLDFYFKSLWQFPFTMPNSFLKHSPRSLGWPPLIPCAPSHFRLCHFIKQKKCFLGTLASWSWTFPGHEESPTGVLLATGPSQLRKSGALSFPYWAWGYALFSSPENLSFSFTGTFYHVAVPHCPLHKAPKSPHLSLMITVAFLTPWCDASLRHFLSFSSCLSPRLV